MHSHDHDQLGAESLRPASAHIETHDSTMVRAAAAGRTDVLGRAGLLSIQRAAGNSAAQGLVPEDRSPVLDVVSSGGQSLDEPVRTDMEARLGHDFSDVRVHTGDAADSSAKSVNAHAYTVGSNIVFQRNTYDPGSASGQTLLAHELTHVVQQRNGPVDGTSTGDGIRVSDPSDRFEREAASNAEEVMSKPAPQPSVQTAAVDPTAVVQRHAGEEEAGVQMSSVQREEEEEEVQGAFVQREEEEEEVQGAFVQRDEQEEEQEETS